MSEGLVRGGVAGVVRRHELCCTNLSPLSLWIEPMVVSNAKAPSLPHVTYRKMVQDCSISDRVHLLNLDAGVFPGIAETFDLSSPRVEAPESHRSRASLRAGERRRPRPSG